MPEQIGVYPRVCGGTLLRLRAIVAGEGLSPRVRGNPARSLPMMPSAGSIPACAGEPRAPSSIPCASGVYPRVCGGTQLPA